MGWRIALSPSNHRFLHSLGDRIANTATFADQVDINFGFRALPGRDEDLQIFGFAIRAGNPDKGADTDLFGYFDPDAAGIFHSCKILKAFSTKLTPLLIATTRSVASFFVAFDYEPGSRQAQLTPGWVKIKMSIKLKQ